MGVEIEETIKEIKKIIKLEKARLYFSKNPKEKRAGWTSVEKQSITISLYHNKEQITILSTFFHELGHLHCKKRGIWKIYHSCKPSSDMSKSEKQKFKRTCLRAEYWVDRWAKKEMKKYYPDLEYVGLMNYDKKHVKKYYYKNMVNF